MSNSGRLEYGLTFWRRRHKGIFALPWKKYFEVWNEAQWTSQEDWLKRLESLLCENKVQVKRGGIHDNWDLEVREGLTMPTRMIMTIEEHGSGKQFLRFRIWPKYNRMNLVLISFLLVLSVSIILNQALPIALIMGCITLMLCFYLFQHSLPLVRSCILTLDANHKQSDKTLLNETNK